MNNNEITGIIIDAGHGGIDSGAVGNNLIEKDLSLKAAQYMYQRLNELGIPVKMTREEDIYLPKNERIKKVLSLYDNNPNTILISNHINAGGGEGAEVVYSLKDDSTLASLILDNIGEAGQIKRKVYQRRLPENPNLDYYYILRETGNTKPILIEYGFIDNYNDSKKLNNNLLDYVEAVVKAIADYTGYDYYKSEDKYIVKKGDTLYSIAKKYGVSVDYLKQLNNLVDNTLLVGEELLLKEDLNMNNYELYTVKKGDSLWAISKEFDISVPDLIKLNNLESINIQIGKQLLVPKKDNNTYIVKKGDTLYSIAKNNNISLDELKQLNNLSSNLLSIGQELIIK